VAWTRQDSMARWATSRILTPVCVLPMTHESFPQHHIFYCPSLREQAKVENHLLLIIILISYFLLKSHGLLQSVVDFSLDNPPNLIL